MELLIEVDTISTNNNSIFGIVYFKENDFVFPDKSWNDFVVVTTGWWCSNILKLLNNESICEDLSFMDGPYTLRAKYVEEGVFELVCIEQDDIVLEVFKVAINEFVTDFLKKVNSLIRQLQVMKIKNEDVKQLEDNYTNLQRIFNGYQVRAL
ncbi:hypothetical protein [Aquimarina algiphila]|uniref:Uncharacterized protein n=1 Tax=Aquimarina algiphila TaxID=2047982 RepID=A0A554VAI1_9FLAO|nr:hypothetical protein [Aquimarina algiphila]TSE03148.1 hypothetical protein FOF46_29880 [Aquimarina algiphila]